MKEIKLYPSWIEGIRNALFDVFSQGKAADSVVNQLLKSHPKWGSKDRKFVTSQIYDIIRWWHHYSPFATNQAEPDIYAEILLIKLTLEGFTPVTSVPLHLDLSEEVKNRIKNTSFLNHSYPLWLFELGEKQLGEKWLTEAEALNHPASLGIRVNQSRVGTDELQRLLLPEFEAEFIEYLPSALVIEKGSKITNHATYQNGLFEIQDPGSQQIVEFLNPQPGEQIIDACAGAGGKTLHIADKLQGRGKVIAMDTHEWKLKNLLFRAKRSNLDRSIKTSHIELGSIPKYLLESADRILLDVPCSALGTLKRHPEIKWQLSEDRLKEICDLQSEILEQYQTMLKPGGLLVYSTCSILPIENELQVGNFLSENPHFTLEAEHMQWPSLGFDGFYMASLRHNGRID